MSGRTTPAEVGTIHHIVVQERPEVDELPDTHEPRQVAPEADRTGAERREHGPEALAASLGEIAPHGLHDVDIAGNELAEPHLGLGERLTKADEHLLRTRNHHRWAAAGQPLGRDPPNDLVGREPGSGERVHLASAAGHFEDFSVN